MPENKALIEKELLVQRNKYWTEAAVLQQIRMIFDEQDSRRDRIRGNLEDNVEDAQNLFDVDLLDADKIFHLTQIRNVCIDYRLRFLDSRFFKNGIPEEAVSKINALEKIHKIELRGFKIMAPGKAFRLLSYDDPLLFAPIGNDYYYLVHKWGNDITTKRKWLMKPFKNLMNFTWFCLSVSLIVTWLTPQTNLSRSVPMASIIIFLFTFKSIVAVFLYAFFMLGKNFNAAIWDRKYFNN